MTLNQKLSEMAEEKIDQAASDYEDKHSHPRHWDCCYSHSDTEKHFSNGAKWALELPEVKALLSVVEFYADENNWNEVWIEPAGVDSGGDCSCQIDFDDVEIKRDSEDQIYYSTAGLKARQALSTWKAFKGEENG